MVHGMAQVTGKRHWNIGSFQPPFPFLALFVRKWEKYFDQACCMRDSQAPSLACVQTLASPAGKQKSGLPSKKEQTAFAYACGVGNGITDSAPGFSGVCVVSLQSRCVIYWGTVPGPFPRNGGRRSRNRSCIPHNGCPRHPEPQDPDGYRACRGQRRRNRPACP